MRQLSAYELQCGYVQEFTDNDINVSLWREHEVYHVRTHNRRANLRLAWDVFENLIDARNDFNSIKNRIELKQL